MMRRREPVRDRRPRGRAARARRGGALGARARRAPARRWRRASTRCCAPPRALAHRAGHAWEQAVLPVRARALRRAPVPGEPRAGGGAPHRRVLHDAAPLRHPGWYSGAYAAWQRRLLPGDRPPRAPRDHGLGLLARRAASSCWSSSPADVSVVAGGVDAAFHPGADAARARAALGLARPYVLCVASQTARKNLGALVPAARALRAQGVDVVVAGGHRPQFARGAGARRAATAGRGARRAAARASTRARSAFALPSHYEGFGLPCSRRWPPATPVVAADAAALPETVRRRGAARPAGRRRLPRRARRAPRRRGRARAAARGRPRAAPRGFTWEATARGVDAVLRRAVPRP